MQSKTPGHRQVHEQSLTFGGSFQSSLCYLEDDNSDIFFNIEDYEEESVDLESENETAALQGATAIPINKCFLCYCLHIKDCLFFY